MVVQEKSDGLKIQIKVTDGNQAVNLSSYETVNVVLHRPDDTTVTEAMQVVDKSAGLVEYTTSASDLSDSGLYQIQAELIDTGQNKNLYTEVQSFQVEENLI
jgi:hypothetical protein